MAPKAKGGRRRLQKRLRLAAVDIVAADAAYVAFPVGRALKVGVLALVTTQALGVYLLGRSLGWIEDLGYIAATLNVSFARSVAAFASDPGLAMHFSQLAVRVGNEPFRHFFVAGRASFCANKVGRNRSLA